MRLFTAFALAGLAAGLTAVAAADDPPAPLLKAVAPGGSAVRLRIPVVSSSYFKAKIPRGGKAKKGEMIDITVSFAAGSQAGGAYTTLKTWQSWGYYADKAGPVVLPELVVAAAQVAPKPAKGGDLELRIPALKMAVTEPPGDAPPRDGGWLHIGLGDLTRAPSRVVEPRLHLADKFLELTLPNAAVRRPGTDSVPPGEVKVNPDPALVPSAGPTTGPDAETFAFSSVNGLTQYKTPDGKIEPVVTWFSHNTGASIVLSERLAIGCGVEMEERVNDVAYVKGKVKELRVALQTGPGLKAPKDIVLKDVAVQVSSERSSGYVILGTGFAAEYFKDGVWAAGTDGIWKLHGRVKPDLLFDPKTRAVPKKP